MALTKNEVVKSIYENTDISKKDCLRIFKSVFEIIKSELENGNKVMISSFGIWNVKSKEERKGRNPQTGERIVIKARKVVTFKPSPVLKDALNR